MANGEPMLTASVIVAVDGGEEALSATLNSLEAQTLEKEKFEAIFVNAGASKAAVKRLKEFAKGHPWATVIAKKQQGIYAARNAGIDSATGKYLFFLDPGDGLSNNTLKAVSAFYDKHRGNVDLVTFKYLVCDHDEQKLTHFRFKILTASGVYDLNTFDNAYVCPTNINICVENRFEDNVHYAHPELDASCFDGHVQYVADVLAQGRLGYCASASYLFQKPALYDGPLTLPAYFSFESTMQMYEEVFERREGKVPRWLQAMLVDEYVARVKAGTLLPDHLKGDERDQAMARIAGLLSHVDDETLFGHPSASVYHLLYLSGLSSTSEARVLTGPGGVSVSNDQALLWSTKKIEVFLVRTRATHDSFEVCGVVRSPAFAREGSDIHLYMRYTRGSSLHIEELELRASSESYYNSPYLIVNLPSFRCSLPLDRANEYSFYAMVDGVRIPVTLVCRRPMVTFGVPLLNTMVCGDKMVVLRASTGTISVEQATKELLDAHTRNLRHSLDRRVRLVRAAVKKVSEQLHKKHDEVWIYTDADGRLDNAWIQYQNDAAANDGVMRYYVANNVSIDKADMPQGSSCKVIDFGSWEHRILHWVADRRLVSDVSALSISPWDNTARSFYCDFDNAEVIYLQHGVLWAHLPWYYGYDKLAVDRMVVSTQFEIDNLCANYGFREEDLIPAGMARYDLMELGEPAQRKILVCPSWRSYLVGSLVKGGREPLEAKFKASQYYKNLCALLESERLAELLDRYDYELELKLHPNFACYTHLFSKLSGRVHIVDQVAQEQTYAAIITDYSSYSFDFAYLNRAIIYYIPDEELFWAGVSNYSSLDMDLDDALGEHARTAEEALDALERILERDGNPYGSYADKEASFFIHRDNNQRNRLREAVRGEKA